MLLFAYARKCAFVCHARTRVCEYRSVFLSARCVCVCVCVCELTAFPCSSRVPAVKEACLPRLPLSGTDSRTGSASTGAVCVCVCVCARTHEPLKYECVCAPARTAHTHPRTHPRMYTFARTHLDQKTPAGAMRCRQLSQRPLPFQHALYSPPKLLRF